MSPLKIPVRLISNQPDTDKADTTLKFLTGSILSSLLCILFVQWIWPNVIPFETFEFWRENDIWAGIFASWPIFAWGWGITTLVAFTTLNKKSLNNKAENILVGGIFISVIAGVFEEVFSDGPCF